MRFVYFLFRVDTSKTIYTGECPSEGVEDSIPETYCNCKETTTCGNQLDRVICPFELDGKIIPYNDIKC